uniref:Uncharacterized protein n=1 Tax=Panagrolaimus davidi TaxID=227884 RepID=A0A914PGP2_9BILA
MILKAMIAVLLLSHICFATPTTTTTRRVSTTLFPGSNCGYWSEWTCGCCGGCPTQRCTRYCIAQQCETPNCHGPGDKILSAPCAVSLPTAACERPLDWCCIGEVHFNATSQWCEVVPTPATL